MNFLVMTDIEGVTGVTTFAQAERTQFGKDMLMNDLKAVLEGIREAGGEAVVYDMHTDGRNVDVTQIDEPVVMGKPIRGDLWRGVGGRNVDGLYMVGLHTMQHVKNALLAHSYLREYDTIHLNGILVGEIGMEAALAAEQGVPLKFVSGDDLGCREAEELGTGIVTCPVKTSLTADTAICLSPVESAKLLRNKAREAALADIKPFTVKAPYEIRIQFSDCPYLYKMRELHPEIFEDENTVVMRGERLLPTWSQYLLYEKEMVAACR
ncbi:MAG: M55 family metallopeptidase [Clostridia bacterium]|nr:M55 family metallopeptidase [Clostridia bacterium]MBQ9807164.1 M55 family metallopeptidase [Clostridia bacterium]